MSEITTLRTVFNGNQQLDFRCERSNPELDVAATNKVIQELKPIIGARQRHDNHGDDGGKVVNRVVPYSTSGPYKSETTGQPSSPTKSFLTQFPVVKESKQSMTTNQNSFPSKVDEKSSPPAKSSENEQHSSSRVAQQKQQQQQQQQQQDFSVFDFTETRPEMFDNSKNISGPILNAIPEISTSSQSSSTRWTSSKTTSSSKKPTSQASVTSASSNKQMTSAAPVVSYADKVSSVVSSSYSVSNTLPYSSQAMKGVISNNSYPSYNISSSGNVASISSSSGNVASISSSSGKVSAQPSYQKPTGTSSMARL